MELQKSGKARPPMNQFTYIIVDDMNIDCLVKDTSENGGIYSGPHGFIKTEEMGWLLKIRSLSRVLPH